MNIVQSFYLGMLQGLTEFLPVSSSAHLVLAPYFFQFEDPGLAFDVALHMGTLLAIFIYYRKDFYEIISAFLKRKTPENSVDLKYLIMGVIPAGILGALFNKYAEETFRSPYLIAFNLAVFGLLLWWADRKAKHHHSLKTVTYKQALIIGCAQAVAIIPGVSRSGITLTAALLLGFSRVSATRFSFLLSAPVIAGAGILKSRHIFHMLGDSATQEALLVGICTSFFAGIMALGLLNYLAKTRTYAPFTVYRILLALFIVAYATLHSV